MTKAENNKRIAKNTLMLYIRMGLVMLISLYVSRVVLKVLGEEDYGIYNVVGGIIVMFSFLSRTLASASQRYFAFELGRGDHDKLNKIFNINLRLFCLVAGIVILLAETIGLWFLHNKMTIPAERMSAANWIYQFSVLSYCANLIAVPYQAVIIAREKMHFYAFVGIMEAMLNLAFALLLVFLNWNSDMLIVYGALMLAVHLVTNGSYVFVSRHHFDETRLNYYWDRSQAKEIISYSGWNLFGAVAGIVRSQGINLLINVFFNPAVNAARGLSYQVNNALNQFASNFYTAVRPQVTKYYAQGDKSATFSLVFSSSKISFFLLLLGAVPVLTFPHEVLDLWLVDIPSYTEVFIVLVIIIGLIDSISNPLMTLAQATGRVKVYQAVCGSIIIMNLPVSWLFLYMGYAPESTMYVAITIASVALFARLFILKNMVEFPVLSFIRQVMIRMAITTASALLFSHLVRFCFDAGESIIKQIVILLLSVMVTAISVVAIGLNKHERDLLIGYLIPNKKTR